MLRLRVESFHKFRGPILEGGAKLMNEEELLLSSSSRYLNELEVESK